MIWILLILEDFSFTGWENPYIYDTGDFYLQEVSFMMFFLMIGLHFLES